MQSTPSANRMHITLFGKRNAGKSTLMNLLTGQQVSLVSPVKGTTTDPVQKAMEFWPLGAVVFIDTPGFDDEGELGMQRISRAKDMLNRTDLALFVGKPQDDWTMGQAFLKMVDERNIPAIIVWNIDDKNPTECMTTIAEVEKPSVIINARTGEGLEALRAAIIEHAPVSLEPDTIAAHLIKPGDRVLLVAPQDIQAPAGRLILPQQQTLRDLLDVGAVCMMVRATEINAALAAFSAQPDLVITDSQVFKTVSDAIPEGVPLTSFSVLMARKKGDIERYLEGAKAIDSLKTGDAVLIAEACSHQPQDGDIGRVKLPKMLQEYTGASLDIRVTAGTDFPEQVNNYKLVIHCGGCMFNRRHVLSRIQRCISQGVPVTNYGIAMAHMQGIIHRVVW